MSIENIEYFSPNFIPYQDPNLSCEHVIKEPHNLQEEGVLF